LSNASDINKNGNGLATNYENNNNTASAFGDTRWGFPLSIPDDLRTLSIRPSAVGKVNCGQYLTTGHHRHGAVCILFHCQLSREKRTGPHYFFSAGIMVIN
jgi:hypothetical protein